MLSRQQTAISPLGGYYGDPHQLKLFILTLCKSLIADVRYDALPGCTDGGASRSLQVLQMPLHMLLIRLRRHTIPSVGLTCGQHRRDQPAGCVQELRCSAEPCHVADRGTAGSMLL